MNNRSTKLGRRQAGLTLIELMIALVLGLIVVGAAIGIFLSNRQTYQATESLGRVQESVRTAFELMARDIREGSGNACMLNLPIANVVTGSSNNWYTNITSWGMGITGTDEAFTSGGPANGATSGLRKANTSGLQLISGGSEVATIASHDANGAVMTLNTTTSSAGFSTGDLLVACNARESAIFRATAVGTNTITHGTASNCAVGLGLPACGTAKFAFVAPGSIVSNLHATRWYVGYNPRGGTSLYQSVVTSAGAQVNQEVLEGVKDMQITYMIDGASSFAAADAITDWSLVTAVRLELEMQGVDTVGVEKSTINRKLIQVIALRNRNA